MADHTRFGRDNARPSSMDVLAWRERRATDKPWRRRSRSGTQWRGPWAPIGGRHSASCRSVRGRRGSCEPDRRNRYRPQSPPATARGAIVGRPAADGRPGSGDAVTCRSSAGSRARAVAVTRPVRVPPSRRRCGDRGRSGSPPALSERRPAPGAVMQSHAPRASRPAARAFAPAWCRAPPRIREPTPAVDRADLRSAP